MSEIKKALRQFVATKPEAGLAEIRRTAFVPELRSVDEKTRTITFVASTEATDRYGDILRVRGWDLANYKKNPVFLWAHKSSDPPIGRTVEIHTEANPPALVQKVQFADKNTYGFADTIFNLYKGGFLNSVSVGFRPLEPPTPITDAATGRMGGVEYTSQELLELSAVPLPANPQAVARALDAGIVTENDVDRCFLPIGKASGAGDRLATSEDWAGLLASVEKLQVSFERFAALVRGDESAITPSEIASVEELEKLLRL